MPYQLFFKAPEKLRGDLTDEEKFDEDGNQRHWIEHVQAAVKKGDVLYDVMAKVDPWNEELVKIAEIKLLEDLQISKWADERLFFRHQRVGRDRHRLWPSAWKELQEDAFFDKNDPQNVFGDRKNDIDWPEDEQEAKELYVEEVKKWGCPFEHFMPANWHNTI